MSVNLEIDLVVYGVLGALLILAGWAAIRFTGILAPEPQHAGTGDNSAGLDSLGKNGGERAGLAGRGRATSPPSPAARRDGMGAQGEPATGYYPPRANTIPRALRGKIVPRHDRSCGAVSGAGNFACDRPRGHGGDHADSNRSGTVTWADSYSAGPDRCSDPPEVSCSDAGCPVHGDYDDGGFWDDLNRNMRNPEFAEAYSHTSARLARLNDEPDDTLTALIAAQPYPDPPGTDLVLAGTVVPWGDATLRGMLATRARDKNIEWGEGLKRTEAVLARARKILPEAT